MFIQGTCDSHVVSAGLYCLPTRHIVLAHPSVMDMIVVAALSAHHDHDVYLPAMFLQTSCLSCLVLLGDAMLTFTVDKQACPMSLSSSQYLSSSCWSAFAVGEGTYSKVWA